ncbi:histidine N-acetyltransferase-like isoform X2 [Haliotis cracherodii]
MSDYHIRRATVDDFDRVMAIGDVYGGIDYLRHRYHRFMDDPNAQSYVYVVGEEIVGFCTPFLVDDGLTFLVRGSRVKKDFQGQGVYGRLMKHVYAEYKDVDSIKYDAMTTNNCNFEAKKDSLRKTHTEISRKNFLNYHFKMEDIQPLTPPTDINLEEVNSSAMMSLFEDNITREKLFPGDKIIIDWVPLRLLLSNMKYILAPSSLALQSRGDNTHVSLLTVGTPIPCEMGIRYSIDVFGSDASVLRHHIIRHMEYLRSLTQKAVVIQIITAFELGNNGDDIVKSLGVPPFDFPMTEMIYFEKSFR